MSWLQEEMAKNTSPHNEKCQKLQMQVTMVIIYYNATCLYLRICLCTSTDVLNDDNTSMLLLHTIMLHVCTYVYVCVHLLMY